MKKRLVTVLLAGFVLLLGACGKTDSLAEAYGGFERQNADGSTSGIVIDKEAVQFENVSMDEKILKLLLKYKKK